VRERLWDLRERIDGIDHRLELRVVHHAYEILESARSPIEFPMIEARLPSSGRIGAVI
jgi:hypothetical protein